MTLQLVSSRHAALSFLAFVCAFLAHEFTKAASVDGPPICLVKAETRDVGSFSTDLVDEASGLALSADGRNFFVTNDSGDKARIFRTALDGSSIEDIRLKDWKPFDVEDLSTGPCPHDIGGDCVAVADIGDNRDRRKKVEIAFVKQPQSLGKVTEVAIAKKVIFKYPEGPRNAEGFAVLNARYGLIVSKQQDRRSRATQPAHVYVIDFETEKAARVATWDIPTWVKDSGLSALVTGIAVHSSKSGELRVLLLTYRDALEIRVATDILTSVQWPPRPWSITGRTLFQLNPLDQQEAIAFDKTGEGFYYTSESPLAAVGFPGAGNAPIRRVEKMTCR